MSVFLIWLKDMIGGWRASAFAVAAAVLGVLLALSSIDASHVRRKLDDQIAQLAQAQTVEKQRENSISDKFSSITQDYAHEIAAKPASVAPVAAAGIAAGWLRVKPLGCVPLAAGAGGVGAPAAPASTDGAAVAVAAVRAGDTADQWGDTCAARVQALTAILQAERQP